MRRQFRFGVQLHQASSGAELSSIARRAEQLGYSTVTMDDHFGDQLAPVSALTALALATSRIHIGALVFGNDFRHPAVLAKEVATLDLLSQGRVELGIGTGWLQREYEQLGIAYDPPGRRIDRMVEALTILRGLFAEGDFSFQGRHYVIRRLDGRPKPYQRPHPPIVIGGGGKRILSIAARQADIVNINPDLRVGQLPTGPPLDTSASRVKQKVDWIRCAAGERFQDIELSIPILETVVTSARDEVAGRIGGPTGFSAEDVLSAPHYLIGTVTQLITDLQRRRESLGLSYIFIRKRAMEAFAPVVACLAGS